MPKSNRPYTVVLAAGGQVTINASGRQIVALSATGGFDLGIDDEPSSPFLAGYSFRTAGEIFEKVRVINTSGASNTISLQIGFGEVKDGRISLNSAVEIEQPSAYTPALATSIAANSHNWLTAFSASRIGLYVTNESTTITVWICGNALPVGIPLGPGETRYMPGTMAIGIFNPGSVAVNIATAEVG